MSRHLSRPAFYFLHQALVRKCDDILHKKYGQGLNRSNAQLFYGYQDGNGELRSINQVLQSTLEAKGYNLSPFRNFSINGRRLNDNVKRYNDQYETILVHDAYLGAYLFFLELESVEQLIEPDVDLPSRIDFGEREAQSIPQSTPPKTRNKITLAVTTIILVLIIVFYYKVIPPPPPGGIDPCADYGHLSGCLTLPFKGDTLNEEGIRCTGKIHHLDPNQIGVLIVERQDTSGKKAFWYKQHDPIEEKEWYRVIVEQPNEKIKVYSERFAIILAAVDSIKHDTLMKNWVKRSTAKKDSVNFEPFPGIIGYVLDRKENLILQK